MGVAESLFAILAGDKALRERLESIGGPELLATFDARASKVSEPPSPTVFGGASLEAAIRHTFVISELDASPAETSALLAASAVLAVNGESRLRVEDASRAVILDPALADGTLLRRLAESEQADAALLNNDDADTDVMTSAWLRIFLRNQTVSLSRQSVKRLAAAFAARSALQFVSGLGKNVPELAELKRLNDLAELVEPLRIMIGLGDPRQILKKDRFAGREAEMTKLRSFVDALDSEGFLESVSRSVVRVGRAFSSGQARLMMISAPGGLGKSTLMAKFALDHAVSGRSFPFAYLDFDRATLQRRSPSQLLIETARQVALYFPEAAPELTLLCDEMRAGLAGASPTSFELVCQKFRDAVRAILSAHGERTFLLILDTFENVQSDPQAVRCAVEFLDTLARGQFPELAIVVSGRAEVQELLDVERHPWSLTQLVLGPLKLADAVQMVSLLGESLIGQDWHDGWARQIAGRSTDPALRREPLTLRIAVEIVRNAVPSQRQKIVDEIVKLGVDADETFVGRLYEKRILEHIGDKDARKLAWPGLVVRRITRDVARTVLAPLCDLTPEQADAAFDRLGREVWIVDRDGDALRHRADLRARTLPLMRGRDPEKFRKLASAMVDHHDSLGSDPQNAAEAVYYRLLRGDDPTFLDTIWSPEVASALASARDDFEAGSAVSLQLEVRLATRLLPPEMFVRLPDALVWGHVARAGSGLRQLDDSKVDRRIVDLVNRPAPEPGTLAPEVEAARQSVLIKAGAWSSIEVEKLVFPTVDIDIMQAAFFATVTAGAGLTSPLGWVTRHPDLIARLLDRTAHTTWQVLAYSLLPTLLFDEALYRAVDQRLAEALPSATQSRGGSRAALRTAILFGTRSIPRAVSLFTGLAAQGADGLPGGSISTAELSVLVSEPDAPGLEPAFAELAQRWLDDRLARRITDPKIVGGAFQVLSAMADTGNLHIHSRTVRRFAAARLEGWVVPVGYAFARAMDVDVWREGIGRRVGGYGQEPSSTWSGWITGRGKGGQIPRDPIRLAALADEASDLQWFVEESLHLPRSVVPRDDLNFIATLLAAWPGQISRLIDGDLSKATANSVERGEQSWSATS